MRFLLFAALAVAVSGCTGSSRLDVLDIEPSSETTSSIMPRPQAAVGERPEAPDDAIALLGPVPRGRAAAPIVEEVAFVPPERAFPKRGNKGMTIYKPRFGDAKPVRFKGADPYPFQVHGVDVSKYQGRIDWPLLHSHGANFRLHQGDGRR
jgi:lysozyme